MSDAPQTNADLHQRVTDVINGIRPYIQADGGDIDLVSVEEDGTVKVRLRGACVGCPASQITLKHGIERTLRQHIPEVREVVAVA